MWRRTSVIVIFLFGVGSAIGSEGNDLLRDVFRQRRTIRSAEIVFDCQTVTDSGEQVHTKVSYWLQDARVRLDCVYHRQGMPAFRMVVGKNCGKDGTLFVWNGDPGVSGTPGSPSFVKSDNESYLPMIPDLRLLGAVASYLGTLHAFSMEGEIGSSERSDMAVRNDTFRAQDCRVVSYTLQRGSKPRFEYWLSARVPANVLKITCKNHFPDGSDFLETLESFPSDDAMNQWSFPSKCRYTRLATGKPSGREELTFSKVAINKPVDAGVFSLAGIGVANGTFLPSQGDGAYVFRDGKLVRYQKRDQPVGFPTARINPNQPTGWLTAALIAFTLSGAGALAVILRNRRARKESS